MEEAARRPTALPTAAAHVPDLRLAIRRARLEDAERSAVVSELRGVELAKLELLLAALQPVFQQIPDNADMFDPGIAGADRPRLFIDMVAFVEMSRDRRGFRFMKETRSGRVVMAESDQQDAIVEAVTTYLARRLVEREKALAQEGEEAPLAPPTKPASLAAMQPIAAPAAPPKVKAWRRQRRVADFVTTLLLGICVGAAALWIAVKNGLLL